MNRTLSVLTLGAVFAVGVSAFLPACGDSPSSPAQASPLPPNPSPSATFAVRGVITDSVGHAGVPGARVDIQTGDSANYITTAVTDNTGAYSISGLTRGTYRVRASAEGYDFGERIVDMLLADLRIDFELRPPAVNYVGVWTGVYDVPDCRDIDLPGFTQFHLCGFRRPQSYQFTLTQSGTVVSGTYKLVTPFYSCPCGFMYGELPMSGSISPDGTLAITAIGNGPGLSGATLELNLLLRHASSSTITGTGTLHLRFGTLDDRSIGSVVIQSGTRTQ
jgi:hypothetical protein